MKVGHEVPFHTQSLFSAWETMCNQESLKWKYSLVIGTKSLCRSRTGGHFYGKIWDLGWFLADWQYWKKKLGRLWATFEGVFFMFSGAKISHFFRISFWLKKNTLTIFWLFWPPTPLRWHFLWDKHWQKVDIFGPSTFLVL